MPRKSLQGRTCSVSREGERARALQPSHRSAALQLLSPPSTHVTGSAFQILAVSLGRPKNRYVEYAAPSPHQGVGRWLDEKARLSHRFG
ncbi:hypothetical protein E1J24_18980 [Xanthomonas hortorum pv. pelargonii]|uniref:Uncharacterized protein n=1 Tax=Xanthomonas hortorum pv. pelargonii TaxID=453602 RepID=A0AAW9ZWD8_9XANT|nr:hypothetical protein [Xanthomonas hortorum pv. pelargonii]